MRRAATFMLGIVFSATALFAQEQLGLRLETYAGVSSLALDPTGNLNNPLKWDINLLGGGFFIENNYAFLQKTSLRKLLAHRSNADFVAAKDVEGPVSENTTIVDFFNNDAKRFVNLNGFVAGPSVAVRIGDSHSLGVFTNLRSTAGSFNIPNEFSYYKYDARPFQDQFEVPALRAALLNWAEIGLNYAMKLPTADGSMNFGISLKYLQGYEAGYLTSESAYLHTKFPQNTISLGGPDGRYGYSAGSQEAVFSERSGRGLGADIGFSYIFQDHEEGYKLKLGASLLDLGYLKFGKNAQGHRLSIDSTVTVQLDAYDDFDLPQDLEAVIRTFSQNSLGDSLATYQDDNFRMALPASLSLQADYGFSENFYVNALYMQQLPSFNNGPRRGNMLALTPRWQHRWFSVSAPVSVYEWSRVHVGLAARVGWLVIGSDNVAGIFFDNNLTGADFYFALKINPFNIGKGSERGSGKSRFGGRSKIKCYTF